MIARIKYLALPEYKYFNDKRDWNGLLQATAFALQDGVNDPVYVCLSRATAYEELHRWKDAEEAVDDARKQDLASKQVSDGFEERVIAEAEAKLKAAEQKSRIELPER